MYTLSTRGFNLLRRQGSDREDFQNKQITTDLNRQIGHWRGAESHLWVGHMQWIFLHNLNCNMQSHH